MGRRKKRIFEDVQIVDLGHKGKAIGKAPSGEVMLVEGVVPGDTLDVLGLRKKKGMWQGIPQTFHQYSESRVAPECAHFEDCGGCKWQHFNYEGQLHFKEKSVRDAALRIGGLTSTEILPILPAPSIFRYRNKMEYSFSARRWITEEEVRSGEDVDPHFALGLHRPGSFDKIVDLEKCLLQPEPGNGIRNAVRDMAIREGWTFFDPRPQTGWLRSLVIRDNSEGQFMVVLVATEHREAEIAQIADHLMREFPAIVSFYFMKNDKKNDSLHDLNPELIKGDEHLNLTLGDRSYLLGPKSFFQTNTRQAKNLYDKVVEFGDFQSGDVVYDLYCGIGSIGLYLAPHVGSIVGIEEIPEAVADAQLNAEHNQIPAHFHCGDVREVLDASFQERYGAPDVVITDPPRAGMHEDVVNFLLELSSPKIVYVSCNPATQARDLKMLSEKYEVVKLQPVDMFPHTGHVEAIALLKLRA